MENTLDQAGLDYPLFQFSGSDDIWAQDFFEPGYTSMPGPGGKITTLHVMIRSAQDDRVAGQQAFEYIRATGRGAVQHLGGARDEINSMGNLETVPPYTLNGRSYPAGRVVMGAHDDDKPWIYDYIKAQEIQDPILLDASWLGIGHIDEIVQFLPTTHGNSSQDSSWAIVVPDPQAGLRILRNAQESGHGSTRAFSRHNNDTGRSPRRCSQHHDQ
jgi:protein-arginine deiminase